MRHIHTDLGRRRPGPAFLVLAAASVLIAILLIVGLCIRQQREDAARKRYVATVLATVNDDPIRQADVDAFSPLPADRVLGILVDFKLLDQAAASRHLSVSSDELQRRRQNIVASHHAATYAVAASSVQRTEAGLDAQLRHAALLEALAGAQVKPVPRSMVHACGIFIRSGGPHAANAAAAQQLARSLQQRLDAGASAAVLAGTYSDDDVSRRRGGDLGIVENAVPMPMHFGDDHRLFQTLTNAASSGQIRGPIAGDHGFWAIRILSTADHPKGEDALYAPAQALWRSYWVQRLEHGVIAQLRSQAKIDPPLAEG